MSGVEQISIAEDEADQRLDRWFLRRYPGLGHGRLAKLLRTGQVRVDGKRVKGSHRLSAGETVRVPPLPDRETPPPAAPPPVSAADAAALTAAILYRDDETIVLDKPPGLAVQGGSGTRRHLDLMLDALRFGAAERPRLVHRLDRDTSGVLVLARTARAAARLAEAFRDKATEKTYWALVAGVPDPAAGTVESRLVKGGGRGRERMGDDPAGRLAITRYRLLAETGGLSWLEMSPLTGRTHQLRVHAVELGTPVVGDGKYGGRAAFAHRPGIADRLHLHARRLVLPRPGGAALDVTAPLPDHMRQSWAALAFGDPDGSSNRSRSD